jgi:hypothetical protein
VVAALRAERQLGRMCSRAFSPGYHRAGFQPAIRGARRFNQVGLKAHYVIARAGGPGGNPSEFTLPCKGKTTWDRKTQGLISWTTRKT